MNKIDKTIQHDDVNNQLKVITENIDDLKQAKEDFDNECVPYLDTYPLIKQEFVRYRKRLDDFFFLIDEYRKLLEKEDLDDALRYTVNTIKTLQLLNHCNRKVEAFKKQLKSQADIKN